MNKIKHEKDMYPAVKKYFKEEHDCGEFTTADLLNEKMVGIQRNLSKRYPDVVGINKDGEVLIAEGKILEKSGHPFEDCVNQIDNLKPCADYLFVFFPKDQWSKLSSDDVARNLRILKEKNIGLILVDINRNNAKPKWQPVHNDTVEDKKRKIFLKNMNYYIGGNSYNIQGLNPESAEQANEILCLCFYIITKLIEEIIKKVAQKVTGEWMAFTVGEDYEDCFKMFKWSVELGEEPKRIAVEVDPFGLYLEDGQPSIWIHKEVSQKFIKYYIEQQKNVRFGTHGFFDNNGECVLRNEITEKQIDDCAKTEETIWICQQINICGRTQSGLKKEIEYFLKQAKDLKE